VKKRILIPALLLLVSGGIIWFGVFRNPLVTTIGNLPPHEVAEINRIVRKEEIRRIFPSISWLSVKRLPGAIRDYSRYQIAVTHVRNNRQIIVSTSHGYEEEFLSNYYVEKGSNGWQVVPRYSFPWNRNDP
jgi:hypothetical protein